MIFIILDAVIECSLFNYLILACTTFSNAKKSRRKRARDSVDIENTTMLSSPFTEAPLSTSSSENNGNNDNNSDKTDACFCMGTLCSEFTRSSDFLEEQIGPIDNQRLMEDDQSFDLESCYHVSHFHDLYGYSDYYVCSGPVFVNLYEAPKGIDPPAPSNFNHSTIATVSRCFDNPSSNASVNSGYTSNSSNSFLTKDNWGWFVDATDQ